MVLTGLLWAGLVFAQEPSSDSLLTVAHYLDMERVSNARLSPDGKQLVYTRSHVDRMADRWVSELWIMNADGSKHRFLAKGSSPQWAPDGTRIAYLTEGEPEGQQLFVRWMDAEGATSQITRVTEPPLVFDWSPDGTALAFVMLVPEEESWTIPMPGPPEGASWTKAPRVVRDLHYRQDRLGFLESGRTHLFVVPADGGTPRALTHGALNVGPRFSGLRRGATIDWTPDGRHVVFDGLREADAGDDAYRQAYLYAVDVASGTLRRLTTEKGYWTNPVVSPNGREVAFTGYPYTLQSYKSAELFAIGLDGQNPRKLSGELDRDAADLFWDADSRGVYFTAADQGAHNVLYAPLNGAVRQVTEGAQVLSLDAVAGGTGAGVRSASDEPGDVVRIDLARGTVAELTHVNDDVLAGMRLGAVEQIWYPSTGGARVQGWVVKPPDFDAARQYPLILHIHGGPHAMYDVGFSYAYQNYAANGYVVLYTNPRGSTGYGTPFGNAIDDAYPSVDHEDLMAGVDAVLAEGYIDPERLYITGCSGGGVLSSWAIGHTDRFAAAAVRCPVTNWMSFAGTADIVRWAYERFDGYFWDNPDKWLAHSPLMHVGKVKTPVLLMTGELDLRTPMSQTEEYFAALKTLGVPAVLLRFSEEYHGTGSKPSNFIRTQLYVMDWFGRYPDRPNEVSMREE